MSNHSLQSGVLTGSLDLVFIDGAHDYDSVSQERVLLCVGRKRVIPR